MSFRYVPTDFQGPKTVFYGWTTYVCVFSWFFPTKKSFYRKYFFFFLGFQMEGVRNQVGSDEPFRVSFYCEVSAPLWKWYGQRWPLATQAARMEQMNYSLGLERPLKKSLDQKESPKQGPQVLGLHFSEVTKPLFFGGTDVPVFVPRASRLQPSPQKETYILNTHVDGFSSISKGSLETKSNATNIILPNHLPTPFKTPSRDWSCQICLALRRYNAWPAAKAVVQEAKKHGCIWLLLSADLFDKTMKKQRSSCQLLTYLVFWGTIFCWCNG